MPKGERLKFGRNKDRTTPTVRRSPFYDPDKVKKDFNPNKNISYEGIPILPQQWKFLTCNAPEVLYSGSVRAGKTRSLCLKAAWVASHPGALVLLCRQNYSEMIHTTLRVLLHEEEGFNGKLPPVLPPGSYTINKTSKIIHIHGGGDIIYMGFDKSTPLASLGLTWAGIDESIEVSEESYNMLLTRLSLQIPGVPSQLCSVTNPGSQASYLYRRFINKKERIKNGKIIYANTMQNYFLPPDYLDILLKNVTGIQRRRLVNGEWCSAEGAVFDKWDSVFVTDRDFGPEQYSYIACGVDWGFKHKSAIIVVGLHTDQKRIRIMDEYTCQGEYAEEVVNKCKDMQEKWGVDEFYYDYANAELGKRMESAGLVTKQANKDIDIGLSAFNNYIQWKDRLRLITVSTRCTQLIEEMANYCYDPITEKPIKFNDDCVDAARYAIMGIHDRINYFVSPLYLPDIY